MTNRFEGISLGTQEAMDRMVARAKAERDKVLEAAAVAIEQDWPEAAQAVRDLMIKDQL